MLSNVICVAGGHHMSHAAPAKDPAPRLLDQPTAVWATVFACTVGFMSIGLVDPILTSIAKGLQATPAQVSLLFTSYFFITSVMMLITGYASSRLGSRRTMMLGAALIVVFAALAGHSTSVVELVLLRGGWGLGNAFFVVTALSVLVAVTRGGTARAVLFYEAAMGLGLSCGPLLGAVLGTFSWRWPFFGTATLMGVGLAAIAIFLPPLPRPAQKIGARRADPRAGPPRPPDGGDRRFLLLFRLLHCARLRALRARHVGDDGRPHLFRLGPLVGDLLGVRRAAGRRAVRPDPRRHGVPHSHGGLADPDGDDAAAGRRDVRRAIGRGDGSLQHAVHRTCARDLGRSAPRRLGWL
jgi:MFS family permease